MSSPDLPGQSATHPPHRSLPDPNRIARSSWLLTRLFPDFSQIFLHTLLESRDFDLLSTLETLVDLLQNGTLAPFRGVDPSIRFYPGIHNAFNPRVLAHIDFKASSHGLFRFTTRPSKWKVIESHERAPEGERGGVGYKSHLQANILLTSQPSALCSRSYSECPNSMFKLPFPERQIPFSQ